MVKPCCAAAACARSLERFHDYNARVLVLAAQVRSQQAHATVDIVPNTARRDNTVGKLGGHHAADGEAIALVHVGHRQRVFHDPWQGSCV